MNSEILARDRYMTLPAYECQISGNICEDGDCRQCNVPIIKAIKDMQPPANIITAPMSMDMERKLMERMFPYQVGIDSTTGREMK